MRVRVKARDVSRSVCSSFHSLAMNILRQADTGAFIMWPCGVVVALGFSQSRKKMS